MSKISGACRLHVVDGKIHCTVCNDFHDIDKWENHEDRAIHTIISLPFKHILYVGAYCKTCNNGKVPICTVCNDFHDIDKWENHEDRAIHTIISLPFKHILYVGAYCKTCNNGKV